MDTRVGIVDVGSPWLERDQDLQESFQVYSKADWERIHSKC
jgi:hypothetical protein